MRGRGRVTGARWSTAMYKDARMPSRPDDDDDLSWIPRGVRDKLDRAAIRIHLADWQRMPLEERRALVACPCESSEEVAAFRARVLELVRTR